VYAKLLAYKDEFEVARLYSSPDFLSKIESEFEGDVTLRFNLAPPLLSRNDALTGRPAKREFGPWLLPLLRMLARLRALRGTPLDPFGYTGERRLERKLIADYESWMEDIAERLSPARHAAALELLRLPATVRGFGPVKRASIDAIAGRAAELHARLLD